MYYLVGENDIPTAVALRLNYSSYPNTCVPDDRRTCSQTFLAWMKFVRHRSAELRFNCHALPVDTWPGAASPLHSLYT